MAMTWDAPLTAAVARELDALLRGARLSGHRFRWEERELSLFFRTGTLRWALHPGQGWVTFLPPESVPPDARPLSARVVGVEAPPDERLLRIHLRKLRGNSHPIQVVVELMTNQWNALLVEGEEERIRHLLWTRRPSGRTLSVGHPYLPPEPSRRRGIHETLSLQEWREITEVPGGENRNGVILGQLAFSSAVNLPALLGKVPAGGGSASGYLLWKRLRSLDPLQPCVLDLPRGKQPYPVVLEGFKYRYLSSVLNAVAEVAEGRTGDAHGVEEILARLDRALVRARGRTEAIRRELARGNVRDGLRETAHLLLANLGEVERGAPSVTLTGFDGGTVSIPLDPALSPHDNVQALYRQAARWERAMRQLPLLLDEAERKANELELLRTAVLEGDLSPADAASRLPEPSHEREAPGEPREERVPYRRFRSSGGLEIRVGRGGSDNDALTFRHSRPEDIWLHARDAAGAHVVLRWDGQGSPPARDLAEAAVLAALHSRARHTGVAPVDWTRRKYVRKPRKAPPGLVRPERVQTLFVEPDPGLPQRLSWDG
jgi:hypothetical protein